MCILTQHNTNVNATLFWPTAQLRQLQDMFLKMIMILPRYEEDKLLEKRRRKLEREEKAAAIKEKNKRQS